MSDLSRFVTVAISKATRTVSQESFDSALVMTYHTVFADLYRVYATETLADDMLTDGFTDTHEAYLQATAFASQNPTIQKVVVGRLPDAPTFHHQITVNHSTADQHVTFNVVNAFYGVTHAVDYTVTGAEVGGIDGVADAVAAIVNAFPHMTASASGAVITIGTSTSGNRVYVYGPYDGVSLSVETTADAGFDTACSALSDVYDDWFAVLVSSGSDDNLSAMAAWAEARPKMFFGESWDYRSDNAANPTLTTLNAAEYDHTVIVERRGNAWGEHTACGWVGGQLWKTPGSPNWAFKAVTGSTPDVLSETVITNIEASGGNVYISTGGLGNMTPGQCVSGEWVDVTHGLLALTARIKEAVYNLLASVDKVPFTDHGLELLRNAVLAALHQFASDDGDALLIKSTIDVTVPRAKDISAADKKARRLVGTNAIKFSAEFAGAINTVGVKGTVSY